ncbi:MAG TPA: glutathione S-transferase family protein [Candidatus Paceibacterota bacterium]|nr:glutathione S-transferase family protein [Candidatus Paceibacterota bacterium]
MSQYVCEQRPGNPLWPRDPQRRADIARWQCWNLAHWAPAIQPYVYQNLFKRFRGLGEADDAVLELAASSFRRYAAVLNDHLANRDFLVGNSETLADFTVASYLTYAEQARVPLQSYPHICRWRAEIWRLKAWQAVLPTLS